RRPHPRLHRNRGSVPGKTKERLAALNRAVEIGRAIARGTAREAWHGVSPSVRTKGRRQPVVAVPRDIGQGPIQQSRKRPPTTGERGAVPFPFGNRQSKIGNSSDVTRRF